MTMLAFYAYLDGDDWGTFVHGETRGKAKYRFFLCDPSMEVTRDRWNDIRLTRTPSWDDKPFKRGMEYNQMFSGWEEEDGDILVDCNCSLCERKTE